MTLKAPYPWFGGKSKVAPIVWARFGDVTNYVEPFFGSGAVFLARPESHVAKIETINDADGYVSNFWRALKHAPDEVAEWADWPVSENDLHARHVWLLERRESLVEQLEGDPGYYDARIAGYWVWGICSWIGSGWCRGSGPWHSVEHEDGTRRLVQTRTDGRGTSRQLPHLGNTGRGVNRKLPHLGNTGRGVNRKRPHLGNAGRGVNRKRPHLGTWRIKDSANDFTSIVPLADYLNRLSTRLRHARVCSGDWSRVCGPSVTFKHGLTGVFLDPPYSGDVRDNDLYTVDDHTIAEDVRQWCIDNGDNPLLRIALCGYDNEGHEVLEARGWQAVAWNAGAGYGGQAAERTGNGGRERIWFSPHCIGNMAALPLFSLSQNGDFPVS